MKKMFCAVLAVCLAVSLCVAGCAPAKASSSQEAIQKSQSMETVKQKTDYLVSQAKAFYNTKQFQDVVTLTQYVMQKVDATSQEAKALLEKAKTEMTAEMKKAAEEMKKQFSGVGKK